MNNLKYLSKQGSNTKPCEDRITVLENTAWVLDGATGITGKKITNSETDAVWYVESINNYLKENINTSKSIKDIVKDAIKETKDKYIKFKGFKDLKEIDYPCAAIALVRFNDNYLEYFVLGDCTIIIKENGEKAIEIVDNKLIELEEKILKSMSKTAFEKNISILEARNYCNKEVLDVRKLKNTNNGYWILELNKEAVDHCLYGKIKIINSTSISLTSDGFSQYYDTFNLTKGYEDFINIVKDTNIEEVYNKLYTKQEEDSKCNNFPRLKKRDDASIIYFEI
ncbi:protein phosphatase 2C domain-containing protein [Clostridium nigeriense]|uniref:protein phosphatase 2C domain-containing protein n=1 Tax=Clostridium nigeriense TaxID=1805470 RepID=UPI000834BD24|nr:protein phosphatase 2C domain-containing protein [Clostridium nigeriense]